MDMATGPELIKLCNVEVQDQGKEEVEGRKRGRKELPCYLPTLLGDTLEV